MGSTLFIYHHLGLGDHIICNGLVRNLYFQNKDKYDTINLFCKKTNIVSVKFLYRDLKKIEIISVNSDEEVEYYIVNNSVKDLIKIGFENADFKAYNFDQAFYKQIGIDFKIRWDGFFFERDLEREKKLFNNFNIIENKYVFVHDDVDRNFNINCNYLQSNGYQIVTPKKGLTENIFDYCYLLENAYEIHCMDSSFKLLIDSINPKSKSLFHHLYVRGRKKTNVSLSKLKWTKIYFRNLIINKFFINYINPSETSPHT